MDFTAQAEQLVDIVRTEISRETAVDYVAATLRLAHSEGALLATNQTIEALKQWPARS